MMIDKKKYYYYILFKKILDEGYVRCQDFLTAILDFTLKVAAIEGAENTKR